MRHSLVPAVYLIFKKDDKVLLLQRANTGYADGMYSLVSGHVEPNEDFIAAAIREAKEEAGITISEEQLRLVHVLHRTTEGHRPYIDFFYEVTRWDGEIQNMEPHKCSDLSWFMINDLPEHILPHVQSVLQKPHSIYSHFSE